MKTVATILFMVLFGLVLARPQQNYQDYRNAYITTYESDNAGLGDYHYKVETSDGFLQEQAGNLRNAGAENEALSVTGYYTYVGPDGNTYAVSYIADENGFQPTGEHLPPAADVKKGKPLLGIPSAALSSLAGGGLG